LSLKGNQNVLHGDIGYFYPVKLKNSSKESQIVVSYEECDKGDGRKDVFCK